jgi:hypothetical protein
MCEIPIKKEKEDNIVTQFAKGNVQITLSQEDVAKAVEYWLNKKILKEPCAVVAMSERRVDAKRTFDLALAEKTRIRSRCASQLPRETHDDSASHRERETQKTRASQ